MTTADALKRLFEIWTAVETKVRNENPTASDETIEAIVRETMNKGLGL